MIKVLSWFKRRADLSVPEFVAHWQGPHAKLALELPGLRKYVQNPAHPSSYARGREPAFDGVAETWFDDLAATRALADSPEFAAIVADEHRFMAVPPRHFAITTEHHIVDGAPPEGSVKQFSLVRRRPDLTVAEFRRHWREVHGPLAVGLPGLVRYVQCVTTDGIYEAGREPEVDGVTVVWFDSFESMRSTPGTTTLQAVIRDQDDFLDVAKLTSVVTTEVPYR